MRNDQIRPFPSQVKAPRRAVCTVQTLENCKLHDVPMVRQSPLAHAIDGDFKRRNPLYHKSRREALVNRPASVVVLPEPGPARVN